MKNIYFIILTILFSCSTTDDLRQERQNIKIWEIKSYIIDNREYINNDITNTFMTHNLNTRETYITYLLTEEATVALEVEWNKITKKLRLDRVNIVQEVTYKQSGKKIELTNVNRNFIIKGLNTEVLLNKINNIIQTEKANESTGIISLLFRIWNPTVIEYIPYPELKEGDIFYINTDKKNIELSNKYISITLIFKGTHQWIGY